MELAFIGIALAFNLISIKYKLERGRKADAILDGGILALVSILFSGTISGLVVATYASAIISVYLWFSPPRMFSNA